MTDLTDALAAAKPSLGQVIEYDPQAERVLQAIIAQPRQPAATERPRRRRLRTAAWVGALLVPVAGISAAGAAGIIPNGAISAFQDNTNTGDPDPDTHLDLTTAQQVFTQPGPYGRQFQVWTAMGPHGYTCVSFVLAPTITVAEAIQQQVPQGGPEGGTCAQPAAQPQFGGLAGSSGQYFAVLAGTADRAELRLPDGSSQTVLPQHGWLAGWVPTGVRLAGAVLTGYNADGSATGDAHPFGAADQ